LLAVIMRADGSSKFEKSHRWGYFPSVSAGWNISNESFLANSKFIDALKLRASYGSSGQQDNVPDYLNYAYWGTAKYNGNSGFLPINLLSPNPLTWQVNTTFNVGTDFELFHHFLIGSIEYFISNQTRLLNPAQVESTTGFQTVYTNSGKIQDRGLEIQLTTNNIKTDKFSWTSSFNISFLKNVVKSLSVDNQLISSYTDQSPTNILKVGKPVGTFIGVRFAGVDPANGDALYYAADGTKERADQVNFTRDETVIGNPRPKFFGGFINNFKYRKFDLLIATQFSYGNKVFNLIRTTYESVGWSSASTPGGAYLGGVYANNDTRVLNAWSHPGQITSIPRPSFLQQNYFPNSDEFLENGSFLKIRTVNLGYTVDKPKYFSSMRIYVQAENLLTATKYIGFDPEVSSTGGGNDTISVSSNIPVSLATSAGSSTITISSSSTVSITAASVNGGSESLTIAGGAAPALTLATMSGSITIAANSALGFRQLYFSNLSVGSAAKLILANSSATPGDYSHHANRNVAVVDAGGLNISSGGTLDMGDNDMILKYAPANEAATNTQVFNLLQSGITTNIDWSGTGITSSEANYDANFSIGARGVGFMDNNDWGDTSFDGVALADFNQVLIKFTYYGDVNCDGIFDSQDVNQLISGRSHIAGNTGWENCDLDYDGLTSTSTDQNLFFTGRSAYQTFGRL